MVGKMNPSKRQNNMWEELHRKIVKKAEMASVDVIFIGDSIIFNFWRYPHVWEKHFGLKSFNFGMRGDCIQHVLWRIKFGLMPINASIVVIHAGTNNLLKDKPQKIAEGILQIGTLVKQRLPNVKVVITGLLPRGLKASSYREEIDCVNNHLDLLTPETPFCYAKPSGWTIPNGELKPDFFYRDGLHLIEEGYHHFSSYIKNILDLPASITAPACIAAAPAHTSSAVAAVPAHTSSAVAAVPAHTFAAAPAHTSTDAAAPAHTLRRRRVKCHRRRYRSPPPSSDEDEDQEARPVYYRKLKFIDFRLFDKLIS